ncbi:hypothetical protein ATANTOWER_028539 [Ataeniobius toweri]|uniref:Uncharacterized protein n=1 Tax=Ataeniobius toweri TaxID=208326 RepID=A0ABU7CIU3_9TELE|nr:hypothetical protein [Ataeniobius toweri]
MASSKICKVGHENHTFKDECTEIYGLLQHYSEHTSVHCEYSGFWKNTKSLSLTGKCMEAVAETFLDGKEGQQLKEKVKQIAMPVTSTRRGELYQVAQTQLNSAI